MEIRLKLLMPLLALAALFLFGLGVFVWPQFLEAQVDQRIADEQKRLDILGTALIHPLRNDDLAQLYSILDGVIEKHPYWYELTLNDTSGTRIYPFSAPAPAARKTLIKLQHQIEFFGTPLGRLQVSIDIGPIQKQHAGFVHRAQILILGMLFLAMLVVAAVQERAITLPLKVLALAARRMAEGDFEVRLSKGGKDEVGQLVDSFERMRSRVKRYQDRLHQLAHHDALTGLPNRILFLDRLQVAIARAKRSKKMLGLLFLDLDDFKSVNDTLGHATGDTLIITVGKRLKSLMREGDTVARLGGDEFTVIVEMGDSLEEVRVVAQRIVDAFQTPLEVEGRVMATMVSIGISMFPEDAEDISGLMRKADIAMYRAKKTHGSAYRFFTGG